jgi:hypothetical protein
MQALATIHCETMLSYSPWWQLPPSSMHPYHLPPHTSQNYNPPIYL